MQQVAQLHLELRSLGMIRSNLSSLPFSVAIAKKGIIRPMRFVTRLCMLVAFFLAIGLTCSEMPELLSFTDDASTDFVQVGALAASFKPRYRVVQDRKSTRLNSSH